MKKKYKYCIYTWSSRPNSPTIIETDEEDVNKVLEQMKFFINDNISKFTRQKFPLNKNEIEIIPDFIEPKMIN